MMSTQFFILSEIEHPHKYIFSTITTIIVYDLKVYLSIFRKILSIMISEASFYNRLKMYLRTLIYWLPLLSNVCMCYYLTKLFFFNFFLL